MSVRIWLGCLLAACGSKGGEPEDVGVPPVAVVDAGAKPPPPSDAAVAQAVRPEHAVFGLVDNRHAVHRYIDGDLVLDAADVGFARYARFSLPIARWHVGHQTGGLRSAVADREASLEVPMDLAMATSVDRLAMRVHGRTKHRLAVRVNGRPIGKDAKSSRVELVDGWQTITLPIEAKRLGVGENQIALETSGPADVMKERVAVEWVRFAAKGRAIVGDPRAAARFDAKANAIELARGATLVWYVPLPDGAHLVASVKGKGCKVDVRATTSDDSFVGGVLDAASGGNDSRIDLTKLSGRVVGLTLTTRDCDRATITTPEIRVHGPAPTARTKPAPPKYVVLWVMDAVRADKVPAFTPGARAQTPNLDELAKTSSVFRQYYVQGNESQTSHSTMWTGLYPAVHGVRVAGTGGTEKLDVRFDLLAGKLADAGLFTSGITGNGYVFADAGYARGFKEFRNVMREAGAPNGLIYGKLIVDLVLARFDALRDRPLYMFFGTVDNHAPWVARKPWIDTYSPNYKGPFQEYASPEDLGFKPDSMGCSIIPPAPEIERLRAIYDSAISYQDQLLGRVVAQLKDWGIWDQTLLVITADHGDEFFEDRRCGHGGSLRDSLVRVPLLVHDPSRFPVGTIDEGAEAVDLMPTILDALGIAIADVVQGESLIGLAQGVGRGWARPSYASMYEYAHAMRIGRWKITVGSGVLSVVDMVGDPTEMVNVIAKHPVERRMLTDNLGMFLALRAQWNKRAWGVTTSITRAGAAALDEVKTP